MARYLILTPVTQFIAISDTDNKSGIYKMLWRDGYYDEMLMIGYDPLTYALDSALASIFDCADNLDEDTVGNVLIHRYLIGDIVPIDDNEEQCINIIRQRFAQYKDKPELAEDDRYDVIIPEKVGVYDIRDCIQWKDENDNVVKDINTEERGE